MAWLDSDQIDNAEWISANDFFAADKGAEIYQGQHIFVRTEDGKIYGIDEQDTQKIQANLNQKNEWPQSVEAKDQNNEITNLTMVSTLFKSQYKVATAAEAAAAAEPSKGGWKDKLNSIKQMAEQTVDKASSQVSKATSEISKAGADMAKSADKAGWKEKFSGMKEKAEQSLEKAGEGLEKAGGGGWKEKFSGMKAKAEQSLEKAGEGLEKAGGGGWKEKFSGLKEKAEQGIGKAGSQLSKAGAQIGAAAKETELKMKGKASDENPGLGAVKRFQSQLPQLQQAAKAIHELSSTEAGAAYKPVSEALDALIEKLSALTPKT